MPKNLIVKGNCYYNKAKPAEVPYFTRVQRTSIFIIKVPLRIRLMAKLKIWNNRNLINVKKEQLLL